MAVRSAWRGTKLLRADLGIIRKRENGISSQLHFNLQHQQFSIQTVDPSLRQCVDKKNRGKDVLSFSHRLLSTHAKNLESSAIDILENYDVGCMPPEIIDKARYCIKHFSSSRSRSDIDKGLNLMLRLMVEMEKINPSVQVQDGLVKSTESFLMYAKTRMRLDEFLRMATDLMGRLERLSNVHAELKPTLKMYNMVLSALSKCNTNDSIKRIEHVLEHMKMRSQLEPNAVSYNALLHAYSKQKHRNFAKQCEDKLREFINNGVHMDTVSYNIVINAWAKSDVPYAANHAEMLLQELQEKHSRGEASVKPNLTSLTTVINAWSRISPRDVEAAQRAEDIFNLAVELSAIDKNFRPNAYAFNAVMNAWSKSSLPEAASKAEYFLNEMIKLSNAGDKGMKLNKISFAICIQAWAENDQNNNSQRAIGLLRRMKEIARQGHRVTPDVGIYNSVVRALANDSAANNPQMVQDIIDEIETSGLQANLQTYHGVIRFCSGIKSDDINIKRDAVRIAAETLLKIQKSEKIVPDSYVFNYFIKVCDRLTSGAEKLKLIKVAFEYCKKSGQFQEHVLSLMKNALNPDELKELLNIRNGVDLRSLKVSDFPEEWRSRSPPRGTAERNR